MISLGSWYLLLRFNCCWDLRSLNSIIFQNKQRNQFFRIYDCRGGPACQGWWSYLDFRFLWLCLLIGSGISGEPLLETHLFGSACWYSNPRNANLVAKPSFQFWKFNCFTNLGTWPFPHLQEVEYAWVHENQGTSFLDCYLFLLVFCI